MLDETGQYSATAEEAELRPSEQQTPIEVEKEPAKSEALLKVEWYQSEKKTIRKIYNQIRKALFAPSNVTPDQQQQTETQAEVQPESTTGHIDRAHLEAQYEAIARSLEHYMTAEQAVIDSTLKELEAIDMKQPDGSTKISLLTATFASAAKAAQEKLDKLRPLIEQTYEIKTLLNEDMYRQIRERDEQRQLAHYNAEKKWRAAKREKTELLEQHNLLGRLIHRRAIKLKDQEETELFKAAHRKTEETRLEFKDLKPLTISETALSEWFNKSVSDYVGTLTKKIEGQYELPTPINSNESSPPVDPKLTAEVTRNFIAETIKPALEAQTSLDGEVNTEDISRACELLEQAYTTAPISPTWNPGPAAEFSERLNLLPSELRQALSQYWPLRTSRAVNSSCEQIRDFTVRPNHDLSKNLLLDLQLYTQNQLNKLARNTVDHEKLDRLIYQEANLKREISDLYENTNTDFLQYLFSHPEEARRLGFDNTEELHHLLGLQVLKALRESKLYTQESYTLGLRLLTLRTAKTIPCAVLNAIRERGATRDYPLLHGSTVSLLHYLRSLTPEHLAEVKAHQPKAIAERFSEINALVQSNPETFNQAKITNPDYSRFSQWLTEAPEFIDRFFSHVEGIEIVPNDQAWPYYDDQTKRERVTLSQAATVLPDHQLEAGRILSKTDEAFLTYERRKTSLSLKDVHFEINQNSDTVAFRYQNHGQVRETVCQIPQDLARTLAATANVEPDILTKPTIDNPIFHQFLQQVEQLSLAYLKDGTPEDQRFVAEVITNPDLALTPASYDQIRQLIAENQEAETTQALIQAMLKRSTSGDETALQILLEHTDSLDKEAKSLLSYHAATALELLSKNPASKILRSEAAMTAFADLLSLPTNEARALIAMLQRLKGVYWINENNIKADLPSLIDLARDPTTIEFIIKIGESSHYQLEINRLPILIDLVKEGKSEQIIFKLQQIQRYTKYFHYRTHEEVNYYQPAIEKKYITDPYIQLFDNPYERTIFLTGLAAESDPAVSQAVYESLYRYLLKKSDADQISPEAVDRFNQAVNFILTQTTKTHPEQNNAFTKFFTEDAILTHLAEQPEHAEALLLFNTLERLEDRDFYYLLVHNLPNIVKAKPEQWLNYLDIVNKIDQSPSQEIQRLKDQLAEQILATDDPIENYRRIESVFVKNNLPTVGKIYNVFSILHPRNILNNKIDQQSNLSPVLRQSSTRQRYYTIYQDLLRIHLLSGNRSYREYLETIQSGEGALTALDQKGIDGLTDDELSQLRSFVSVINTLFDYSRLSESTPRLTGDIQAMSGTELRESIDLLRQSLRTKPDQSLSDRLSEMYLRPIGVENFNQALTMMRQAKTEAHQRGLKLASQAAGNRITIEAGDFLKGVNDQYIHLILQNGSVAKEFLGASADSDATPFDTDIGLVRPSDVTGENVQTIRNSVAANYGHLILGIKDRGQFNKTDNTLASPSSVDPTKMELFHTGVLGEQHYGIRTGLPATEIDYIVARKDMQSRADAMEKLCFEIAQNGYYIPITNEAGDIIFTPAMYENLRQTFAGLKRFDGPELEINPTTQESVHHQEIQQLKQEMQTDREKIAALGKQIHSIVAEVLAEEGISLKDRFDRSLIGAELINTGSTGRNTNKPGDYDFDLALRIDDTDAPKMELIAEKIVSRLRPTTNQSHAASNGQYYQVRSMGSMGLGSEPVDVDINITRKSELAVYGTYKALEEKLDWIDQNLGSDRRDEVLANIVLTKKVLSQSQAYKQYDHGGLGGVGVENWILANNGNMIDAFKSFWRASRDSETGQTIDFPRFVQRYRILNAGVNMRKLVHDNYVADMSESGYNATLKAIEDYFKAHSEPLS